MLESDSQSRALSVGGVDKTVRLRCVTISSLNILLHRDPNGREDQFLKNIKLACHSKFKNEFNNIK